MSVANLALQRSKYKHLTDEQWRWFLQQVEGRERTADKLPTFATVEDWWYPVRLSCEQCSSELTAKYKASLIANSQRLMADLTGGYGVDTYFLSELFEHTDYVEQNAELCRIAAHNFGLPSPSSPKIKEIHVHNATAEDFLKSAGLYDLIFIDPARRDSHGGKVFRLEDCTPNAVELLPALQKHLTENGRILLKLSPMLDLTQALKALSAMSWDVHVVAIKNEVKELLLLSQSPITNHQSPISNHQSPIITAIDLNKPEQKFVFTREEESNSEAIHAEGSTRGEAAINSAAINYLYEPNAAILKAGAYKLVAQRFGLHKLDANTHLYCSENLIPDFPGRVWSIKEQITNHHSPITNANVLVRNYPLTPEQLKKKLHLRDGGTAFVIGCRVQGKPSLFLAERIEDIHAEG